MSLTPSFFFWLGFGLLLSIGPLLICLLILHFLMPKAVLDRYWKEPYFRPFELMFLSGFGLFTPLRTMLFMWMFTIPRAGRRRGIVEPHRLIPRWYRVVSITMCVWASVATAGFFTIMLGLALYAHATGNSKAADWKVTVGLILSLGSIAFVALRQRYLNRRDDKAKRERSLRGKKDKPA